VRCSRCPRGSGPHSRSNRREQAGKVTDEWLAIAELALERAVAYFGAERERDTLRVSDVRGWIAWLEAFKTPQGRRLGPGTIRHQLNALSNLYLRAQEEEIVLPGYNPVATLMEKPAGARLEARWLEIHDAALLLEAARQLRPLRGTMLDGEAIARLRREWADGRYRSKRAAARAGSRTWSWAGFFAVSRRRRRRSTTRYTPTCSSVCFCSPAAGLARWRAWSSTM
jgi:hypothetical protein